MNRHRLPDLEIDLGRASRWVDAAVRVTLATVALLLAGAAVAVVRFGLADSLRAVASYLGWGS